MGPGEADREQAYLDCREKQGFFYLFFRLFHVEQWGMAEEQQTEEKRIYSDLIEWISACCCPTTEKEAKAWVIKRWYISPINQDDGGGKRAWWGWMAAGSGFRKLKDGAEGVPNLLDPMIERGLIKVEEGKEPYVRWQMPPSKSRRYYIAWAEDLEQSERYYEIAPPEPAPAAQDAAQPSPPPPPPPPKAPTSEGGFPGMASLQEVVRVLKSIKEVQAAGAGMGDQAQVTAQLLALANSSIDQMRSAYSEQLNSYATRYAAVMSERDELRFMVRERDDLIEELRKQKAELLGVNAQLAEKGQLTQIANAMLGTPEGIEHGWEAVKMAMIRLTTGEPPPPPTPRTAGERMRELQALFDQGLIDAETFRIKKDSIIRDL